VEKRFLFDAASVAQLCLKSSLRTSVYFLGFCQLSNFLITIALLVKNSVNLLNSFSIRINIFDKFNKNFWQISN